MRIEVLGPGCPRCETLRKNAQAALDELGIRAVVTMVIDPPQIAARGVFTTPGLAIDGETVSSGHLLSVGQIKELLQERVRPG